MGGRAKAAAQKVAQATSVEDFKGDLNVPDQFTEHHKE